jgi:hypothetical protein
MKWLSRKFVVSVAAQVTAIAVLIWPEHEQAISSAAESVTALVVLALASLGYVRMEGSLDRASLKRAMDPAGPS